MRLDSSRVSLFFVLASVVAVIEDSANGSSATDGVSFVAGEIPVNLLFVCNLYIDKCSICLYKIRIVRSKMIRRRRILRLEYND